MTELRELGPRFGRRALLGRLWAPVWTAAGAASAYEETREARWYIEHINRGRSKGREAESGDDIPIHHEHLLLIPRRMPFQRGQYRLLCVSKRRCLCSADEEVSKRRANPWQHNTFPHSISA